MTTCSPYFVNDDCRECHPRMFEFNISSYMPPGDFDRHWIFCFNCGCYLEHSGDEVVWQYPCQKHHWRTKPRSW